MFSVVCPGHDGAEGMTWVDLGAGVECSLEDSQQVPYDRALLQH